MKKNCGFTLVELMIVIGIIAVGITLAVPSFRDLIERKAVGGAADAVYAQLQMARSQAVKRSKPILVDFYIDSTDPKTDWAIGITDKTAGCNAEVDDVSNANACTIDYNNDDPGSAEVLVLKRIVGADYKNITMRKITGFANPAVWSGGCTTATLHNERACFDFLRGLSRTGAFEFDSNSDKYKLRVQVDQLGHVNVCVPANEEKIVGYDSC